MGSYCGNREESAPARLHAVLVPFPAQGHITPHLQLARQLVRFHGFTITFVNTTHNHERLVKSQAGSEHSKLNSSISFVEVSDGLPEDDPRMADLPRFCDAVLQMGPTFAELFGHLLAEKRITCVIRDISMPCVHNAAKKHGIPVIGFVTPSAVAQHCYYNINRVVAGGLLPLPAPTDPSVPSLHPSRLTLLPPQSDEEAAARKKTLSRCLPGLSLEMTVGDLPSFFVTHDMSSFFCRHFLQEQNSCTADCECLLMNTFFALESAVIQAIVDQGFKVFPVGPLVFNPSSCGDGDPVLAGAGSALWAEDAESLHWLDGQQPSSVLYVSFGSMATVSIEQIHELAHGLESSNHTFMWVIRPDLVEDADDNKEFLTFFAAFVERTRDRAFITPWVSQAAVLAHPSIAAFLTHCGWNSTLESISSGVPMLVWPKFAEQQTNAFYITHVWRVGLGFECHRKDGLVVREEVTQKVRTIMARGGSEILPEVDAIRERAKGLQQAARKAVMEGGTSQRAMLSFVNHVSLKEAAA